MKTIFDALAFCAVAFALSGNNNPDSIHSSQKL